MAVQPTAANPIVASAGKFQILSADGKTITTLSFAAMLIKMGIHNLESSRGAFQTQFSIAESKVGIMQKLNTLMQEVNNLKTTFKADAKGDAEVELPEEGGMNKARRIILKYGGLLPDLVYRKDEKTNKFYINKQNLETYSSNIQTAQSTLSSENEQQNMRTNQAMNRASGFLQQLQAALQNAKEAMQSSSKAGGIS